MNNDQPPFMRGAYRKQFEASVKQAIEEKPVSNTNNLLKRIHDELPYADELSGILASLLRDCRAEIASLHDAAQQQAVVIERLSKPYVPMTDDEIIEIADTAESNAFRMGSIVQETGYEGYRAIEAAVIKRLGLEIKHD